jgi:hypothetical protein
MLNMLNIDQVSQLIQMTSEPDKFQTPHNKINSWSWWSVYRVIQLDKNFPSLHPDNFLNTEINLINILLRILNTIIHLRETITS